MILPLRTQNCCSNSTGIRKVMVLSSHDVNQVKTQLENPTESLVVNRLGNPCVRPNGNSGRIEAAKKY